MGKTIVEKIISRNVGRDVKPGDIVTVKVDRVMCDDIMMPFITAKFREMGFQKVWDPDGVVIICDHLVPASQVDDIRAYRKGADGEVLEDAIFKGDYDADADAITAEGFFDPDKPVTVIFSHDEEGNVVWTENEESTVLEYCFENAEG